MKAGAGLCPARVPPGASSCVDEKPLEAGLSTPQLRFDFIQLTAALVCELQLAFDVLERLRRELSLLLWVRCLLEPLPHEVQRVLGLEHADGCPLCRAEHLSQLRPRPRAPSGPGEARPHALAWTGQALAWTGP